MPISPYDHQDIVGLEPPGGSQYGAGAAQRASNRTLKQYAPQSMKLLNIDPGTARGQKTIQPPKKVAPLASPASMSAPAPATPGPQNPGSPVSQPQGRTRGYGPSAGLTPESPPVNAQMPHRGYGPSAGIVPPAQEGEQPQPLPPSPHAMFARNTSEAFRHLAALPHASPLIKMYARISAQRDQQRQQAGG